KLDRDYPCVPLKSLLRTTLLCAETGFRWSTTLIFPFLTSAEADKILLPNPTITARFSANIFAMLTTLRIRNLALVADLTLELRAGYTAITGETGAGKSILIGALNLVLGQRAERTLIRNGSDSCSV